MSRSTLHPPKLAYHVDSSHDGYAGVTFYCPTCCHWLWRWFEEEHTPETGAVSDGWHATCRLINTHNPLRCNNVHDIIPMGPAPQSLLDWFEAGKPDWPQCPEDFDEGAVR